MSDSRVINGLWTGLGNDFLESILRKAEVLERSYDWLDAADCYNKASELCLQSKDLLRAADLFERLGFCFYRAAFQAQFNGEFKSRLEKSIQAYEKEISLITEAEEKNKQVRIKHTKALIAYTQSLLETSVPKTKELLFEWWNIEHQVLEAYEDIGDLYLVGRTCNDLTEFSDLMFWLENDHLTSQKLVEEKSNLVEKAINIFSKLDDIYELARAYRIATSHYGWGEWISKSTNEIIQIRKKCQDYSKKALELAEKTEDARLISWAYASVWMIAHFTNMNPKLAVEYGEKRLDYARITKDTHMMAHAFGETGMSYVALAGFLEDPDKQRESLKRAIKMVKKSLEQHAITNNVLAIGMSHNYESLALRGLARIEPNPKIKQDLLEKAIEVVKDGINHSRDIRRVSETLLRSLSIGLRSLSVTKSEIEEKRRLLQDALTQAKKYITFSEELVSHNLLQISDGYFELALVYAGLAEISAHQSEKIELLSNAAIVLEKCIRLTVEKREYLQDGWAVGFYFGRYYAKLGQISQKIYTLTKEEKRLVRAVQAYEQASLDYEKAEMPSHLAESYWHTAQINHELGKLQEASRNYESASKAYDIAAIKIYQLKDFYTDFSLYMQAWSQIEQAKYAHSIENYDEAEHDYENAAKLHQSTDSWRYLAPNYFAWASMEEAESLSRKENTQQAKDAFKKALEQFTTAEKSIKQKIREITSREEKELNQRLIQASNLRRKFCQARIQIEEAKLMDREGKYLQSSKSYQEAAQSILSISEKVESEAERKELEYLAVLCQAWEKMAVAEETTSSGSYLEAARLFEKAKKYCYTKKASLWALGNSNFCRGLAAGLQYKATLNLTDHAKAKGYIKNASTDYLQAGFNSASEYAKATQRLFDAYVFINQAEGEIDQEKRAKHYQMAENLLQIAAGSFMKAKQPEKTAQVQQIIKTVREEKALAVSLNDVMHAPTITSSTMSFSAPSPTSEVSVGLEHFQHANVQANIIAGTKEVKVGESFCLIVEFVNAGKEPALLIKVEDFVPPEFIVVKKPEIYRLEESCLNMKGKQIAPLKLVEAKLVLQPLKKGVYQIKPKVHYLDELGQNKSLQMKSVEIKVEEVLLSDRVSTGTKELDSLLLGGIPKEYAVVLTGSPSDERERIIKNFLEAGAKEGQTSFYVTTETIGLGSLLEKPGFYLFICNPKPKIKVPDVPNVHKLLGKTDLTNLNIALLKAYRSVEQSSQKRVCLDVVSDVLLHHGAETTRRWISELITDMSSKGFTMLAVLDPSMHPPDQANAILNLFDGEISLYQTDDPLECKKSLRVKKLRNQDYIKNPICLTKSAA